MIVAACPSPPRDGHHRRLGRQARGMRDISPYGDPRHLVHGVGPSSRLRGAARPAQVQAVNVLPRTDGVLLDPAAHDRCRLSPWRRAPCRGVIGEPIAVLPG